MAFSEYRGWFTTWVNWRRMYGGAIAYNAADPVGGDAFAKQQAVFVKTPGRWRQRECYKAKGALFRQT